MIKILKNFKRLSASNIGEIIMVRYIPIILLLRWAHR
jgi:hypothetical protein